MIKIKIKDMELSVDNAREIYIELQKLFGDEPAVKYYFSGSSCSGCPYNPYRVGDPWRPLWGSGTT